MPPPKPNGSGGLITYLGLRLLAVVGVLLILERLFAAYQGEGGVGLWEQVRIPRHGWRQGLTFASVDSAQGQKSIVAASISGDDTSWIDDFLPDWTKEVFTVDDIHANLTVVKNKGNEVSAYLTYIITRYYKLPDYMVFIHARRYQWHNEDPMYDHVPTIQNLQLRHLDNVGYADLRCSWVPGCPVQIEPDIEAEDGIFGVQHEFALAHAELFPDEPMPDRLGGACCAQFAVTRTKVLQRPVTDYERYRQWIWETPLVDGRSGRIMEYLWHIIFGMPAVNCPKAEDCFCKTFGMCNLTCTEADCGRYWLPRYDQPIPSNWPDPEAQGQNGWPVDGWWLPDEPAEEEAGEIIEDPMSEEFEHTADATTE